MSISMVYDGIEYTVETELLNEAQSVALRAHEQYKNGMTPTHKLLVSVKNLLVNADNIGAPSKVNHPSHYNQGKYEVIDVIDDWKLGFYEGNIVKYIARYKFKNGLEDLKKAKFYLDRLVRLCEDKENREAK